MVSLWTPECQAVLTWMKESILKGLMLVRPNPARRFYLKTDWSKDVIGAVLLQADYLVEG